MNLKNSKDKLNYDRNGITAGIMHIGVGNFHRAHEAYYINRLLSTDASQKRWGICGVMLLPSDEKIYNNLKDQVGEYTLTECARNGRDRCSLIGSEVELLWGPADREAVLDKMADPNIKIISMTITEGGYNIDKENGTFNMQDPDVCHDMENPRTPESVFGYIAEGLRRRRDRDAGGVTILSCDNVVHNGDTAAKALMSFAEAQDAPLAEWMKENVRFPNCMVDRITPVTLPGDVERLNRMNGTTDRAPVYCEDFIQWVVEDNFAAGRPDWEQVGVQMTNDVTDYENMKLSLLNGTHTLLCYPSFLSGYRKVDEAVRDPRIEKFMRDFMDMDVTPYVTVPAGIDLSEYKEELIERFGNSSVSDRVARLCADGLSKFPIYITPNMTNMVEDGRDLRRVAFLLASYRHYLRFGRDDNGSPYQIDEPRLTDADHALIYSDDPLDFLDLSAFAGAGLRESDAFKTIYMGMADSVLHNGAMATLEKIINAPATHVKSA